MEIPFVYQRMQRNWPDNLIWKSKEVLEEKLSRIEAQLGRPV